MIGKPTRGKAVDVTRTIELYKQGMSINKIGDALGHHHGVIAYHIHKNNIPIRPHHLRYPNITTEYLTELYMQGMSTSEIGEKVNLSAQSIYTRLLKARVKLRSFSEAIALAHKRGRIVQIGDKNPLWKGGRSINEKGYVELRINKKQITEHKFVWENANGKLPLGWVIHHLNGIRTDNRLDNLCAMPRKRHSPNEIIKPHQERIRQLEKELEQCKLNLQPIMNLGV